MSQEINRPAIKRTQELCRERAEARDIIHMYGWGYEEHGCRTTGCLAGWMTLDPALRAMGLYNHGDLLPDREEHWLLPRYGDVNGVSAMTQFLDITENAFEYVFGVHNADDWDEAIERLQELLDGRIG